MIPVLPVVAAGERTSRFIPLQSLRRQALIKQNGLDGMGLNDGEWAAVRREIEEVLFCAYRRRLRMLTRAQRAFKNAGFNWQVVDDRLRIYRADKKKNPLHRVIVLSHCSVHDVTYLPALLAYWNHLLRYKDLANANEKLYIYDRERVLSEAEMETLSRNLPDINMIIVHYNELEVLVDSLYGTGK